MQPKKSHFRKEGIEPGCDLIGGLVTEGTQGGDRLVTVVMTFVLTMVMTMVIAMVMTMLTMVDWLF